MNKLKEFEENLQNNSSRLLGYICSLAKSNAHADDIFQKVSLTIWRRYNDFDNSTEFMSWACTIAKYEISNYHRTLNRCPVCFNSEIFDDASKFCKADSEATVYEIYEKLYNALKSLDKESRDLLISVYVDNEEAKDLAKKAGKSPQTYYNKLNLAKKKLKVILNEKGSNN